MDRAASWTFNMVPSVKDTPGLPLKIIETVDWEMSSASAMSRVVTFFRFPKINTSFSKMNVCEANLAAKVFLF